MDKEDLFSLHSPIPGSPVEMLFALFWDSTFLILEIPNSMVFLFLRISNYSKCIMDSWEFLLTVIISLNSPPLLFCADS